MRERPKPLDRLAAFLALIAASIPIQIMVLYEANPLRPASIVYKISPLNWLIMISAPLLALLVIKASRWVLFFTPPFLILVAWNNYLVAEFGSDFSSTAAHLATVICAASFAILARKEIRQLFVNPNQRWWLTPDRIPVRIPITVRPVLGGDVYSKTADISEGGAFVCFDDLLSDPACQETLSHLKAGNRCSIRMKLDQLHTVHCQAEVVRKAKAKGSYPNGIGIRFINLNTYEKNVLSRFLKEISRTIQKQQQQLPPAARAA